MVSSEIGAVVYSSAEVAEQLSNITYRMLDWWIRENIIAPYKDADGSGKRRQWSDFDLKRLQVLDELLTQAKELGLRTELKFIKTMWESIVDPEAEYNPRIIVLTTKNPCPGSIILTNI